MTNLFKNSSHRNQSDSQNKTWPEPDPSSIAILSFFAVAIIVINGLVFFLFFKKKSLRTPSNYALFSLAACDLFTGLINIPLHIISGFVMRNFFLGFLLVVLHIFVAVATVAHIVTVTAERYMAIKMPLKHRLISKKSVYKALAMVWLTAALISFIPFAWISLYYPVQTPDSAKLSLGYAVFCLVVVVLLPYIFLVSAFVVMFKVISVRSGSAKENTYMEITNNAPKLSTRERTSERKCLLVFATIAFVFLVCWFPWFLMLLLTQLWSGTDIMVPSQVISMIRYLSSIINPMLYTFLKRDFLQALKSFLKRDSPPVWSSARVNTRSLRQGTLRSRSSHKTCSYTCELKRDNFNRMTVAGDKEENLSKESSV